MANDSSAKSSCGKTKCVVILLESKLAILDHLKAGAIQENLANECGIGCSSVGDIKKNEDKIRSFALTIESVAMSKKGRKVRCLADDDKLDKAVYLWFFQKSTQDMPVSRPILL